MASKVFVVALLCVAFLAFVQSAPQYTGEEPTYDDDEESVDLPANAHANDEAASEDEFDPSELSTDFGTAADPGRRLGEGQTHSESGSASSE
uniref:Salivary thrombin inhibitor anophelin n=1 Tax=Anopheles dirus TaxID=7168 RepID=A0A182NTN3_9DIPT